METGECIHRCVEMFTFDGRGAVPSPCRLFSMSSFPLPIDRRRSFRRPTAVVANICAEGRPVVQLMFALRFIAGVALAGPAHALSGAGQLLITLLGWQAVSLAIYVTNGLTDLSADRANHSTRPLASGRLTAATASTATVGLYLGGLSLLAIMSPTVLALGVAFAALGVAYSCGPFPAKKHWATAAVCCGGGGVLTFLAGALAQPGNDLTSTAVLPILAAGLWMALAGASKDIGDVIGDRAAGRRTLPVVLGVRGGSVVIGVTAVISQLTVLALHLHLAGRVSASLVVMSVGSVVFAVALTTAARRPRCPYRTFMITQFLTIPAMLWPL